MFMFKRAATWLAAAMVAVLAGCAHPIGIGPIDTPVRDEARLSPKKAAYVMSDAERSREVITPGGGGDKVSYFPYRDLEKALRDALRAVYSDVFVVPSSADTAMLQSLGATVVYRPVITTQSSSPSLFTWPPTEFTIDLRCEVTDIEGRPLDQLTIQSRGTAEFAEFKSDFGLAGRRAATRLSEELKQSILTRPGLR
ncbi:hypothetical protein [Hydrogenophaga sp. R2]|uniref:hypothetical protein n=1 Tax=Hydrogenophaga sp. R2 TaxID=3132827 RepID=UPI003CF01F36